MKKALALLLSACMVLSLAACGNSQNETTAAETTAAAETTEAAESGDAETTAAETEEGTDSITITDMSGTEVTIPLPVEKVVNGWPASNSVMLLIGAGPLLTGTMQATINNEWSQLIYPDIVNVPVIDSNVEEILAAEPDLYITSDSELAQQVRDAGVPAVNLMFSDYDTMKESFTTLGQILGGEYQEKLTKWCEYQEEWESTIRERLADVPEEEKPVLYYCSAQQSDALTATFATDSICGDWTDICGAVYLGSLASDPNASELTEEEILALDPDVIIVGGIQQASAFSKLEGNEVWSDVTAVKDGRYYLAPMGMFSWCRFGMESAMMLPWLAQTLYPDRFTDIDMEQIVFDFYKDFAGVELTDTQIANMLVGLGPNE